MLVGHEGEKMHATITTTKEEVDYQFWYRGIKIVIKENSCIKDNYSWESKETQLVYCTAKKRPNWFTVRQKKTSRKHILHQL